MIILVFRYGMRLWSGGICCGVLTPGLLQPLAKHFSCVTPHGFAISPPRCLVISALQLPSPTGGALLRVGRGCLCGGEWMNE